MMGRIFKSSIHFCSLACTINLFFVIVNLIFFFADTSSKNFIPVARLTALSYLNVLSVEIGEDAIGERLHLCSITPIT